LKRKKKYDIKKYDIIEEQEGNGGKSNERNSRNDR